MAKPATKTKPVATKKPAAAAKAPVKATDKAKKVSTKATEAKATTKPEVAVLEPNTFVKFAGYVSEVAEGDQDFAKGDVLYIVGVTAAEITIAILICAASRLFVAVLLSHADVSMRCNGVADDRRRLLLREIFRM